MFQANESGGQPGGGDPWADHPLVLIIRAESDKQVQIATSIAGMVRKYMVLTTINVIAFGSFAALQVVHYLFHHQWWWFGH